ncbi:hypothetical protein A2U01_0054531, partial [Trifolium medium]|nr:hypothetical protein [Trifolium medium]
MMESVKKLKEEIVEDEASPEEDEALLVYNPPPKTNVHVQLVLTGTSGEQLGLPPYVTSEYDVQPTPFGGDGGGMVNSYPILDLLSTGLVSRVTKALINNNLSPRFPLSKAKDLDPESV